MHFIQLMHCCCRAVAAVVCDEGFGCVLKLAGARAALLPAKLSNGRKDPSCIVRAAVGGCALPPGL